MLLQLQLLALALLLQLLLPLPQVLLSYLLSELALLRQMVGHEFWDEGFSYEEVKPKGICGHRQVTDAWLAELARKRGGKLATLDAGLAQEHTDVAELIP